MGQKLRVLFVASEGVPFAKTGGLADIVGTLPQALEELGVEVKVLMPYYGMVKQGKVPTTLIAEDLEVNLGLINHPFNLMAPTDPGSPFYFVERDEFYERSQLYGTPRGDYFDNLERFAFFSGAVLTYALQNWRWYLPHARDANAATRMSLAFAIVEHVHQEFRQRRLVSRLDLARTIGQPETLVQQVVDQLLTAGILRLVDDASRDLLPSTPEEMLDPAEVVDMVLGGPPPGFSHHPLADIATAAARAAVSEIGFHPAPAEQAPETSKCSQPQ